MHWPKLEWGKARKISFWMWLVAALVGIMLVQRDNLTYVHPVSLLIGMLVFFVAMYKLNRKP